jgi:hypothetical protein
MDGTNPDGVKIFLTRQDWPWILPSLLYNGYRVSFLGVERSGLGVNHPFSAEVKEKADLYFYSPSSPSWPVIG